MTFAERIITIVANTTLPMGWVLSINRDREDGRWILRVSDSSAVDNVTGQPRGWTGRKWLLSEHMTDGEIVQIAFLATMTAIEHEIRETFLYRGTPVFDPHYDIEKLVALRNQPDALKERT